MPRRKALPSLPLTVDSTLGPVEVRLVESIEGGKTLGRFLCDKRLIELDLHQHPTQLWHTFFHEWCHLVLWDAGAQLSPKAEETVCDVVATWRTKEFVEAFMPIDRRK